MDNGLSDTNLLQQRVIPVTNRRAENDFGNTPAADLLRLKVNHGMFLSPTGNK